MLSSFDGKHRNMSNESPRSPEGRFTNKPDTVEVEAIESDEKRVEYELGLGSGDADGSLMIEPGFGHPIEFRFGRTRKTSPCLLVHGRECPQLGAEYVLVQPDVIAKDPRKGWMPIGGHWAETQADLVYVGREDTPQFRFGPDVSRCHAYLSQTRTKRGVSHLTLAADEGEPRYVRVVVHPDDLREPPPEWCKR
jgi:hypothetical protein